MKNKKITQNKDADELAEGVSYEKGKRFENEFAKFMKSELGWTNVRVGSSMTGKNNAKGTTIDILGMKLDELGIKYKDIAIKWTIGSVSAMVLSLIWWIQQWGENGHWFFIITLLSLLASIIFRILSLINHKNNAWVECKNLKTKATVSHINKMLNEYRDFKLSKNDDYRFTHLYFVSANGFVENALKLATDNNITCYEKTRSVFKEVKYYNI